MAFFCAVLRAWGFKPPGGELLLQPMIGTRCYGLHLQFADRSNGQLKSEMVKDSLEPGRKHSHVWAWTDRECDRGGHSSRRSGERWCKVVFGDSAEEADHGWTFNGSG